MISHYIFSYGRTVFVMATLTNYIGFLCTNIQQLYVCVVQYHQMSVHAFSLLFSMNIFLDMVVLLFSEFFYSLTFSTQSVASYFY